MNATKLERLIKRFLERKTMDRDDARVQTFEEAGVLTRDNGVVLKLRRQAGRDRELYITITEQ